MNGVNSRKGERGLMLVEDPKDTIKTMCQFRDSAFDLKAYKLAYEMLKGRKIPIHEKNAHTHFYSLSIYGFIVPDESTRKGMYRLSSIGKELCKALEERDLKKYRQILSNTLLNNPRKGPLFKRFLSFLNEKERRTRKETSTEFRELPARTLVAWSKEVGLIETDRDYLWGLPREKHQVLTLEEFRQELIETYNSISKTEMLGVEKVFVQISELRRRFCIKHSWTYEEFDEFLRTLLDSPFGEKVRFYGAPSSAFDEKENFMYQERLYVYIRMKV